MRNNRQLYAKGDDQLKLRSYANNLYGVLLLTNTERKAAAQRFLLAYQDIMQLPQPNDVVDICINAADVARQMGHLADASSWYRRANFLADSLHVTSTQNSILAGLGQVYNDLKNYRLAHTLILETNHYYAMYICLYCAKLQ